MKIEKTNKISLGVFVTFAALFLIIAIYFIGKKSQLFNKTFRITGIFHDISGLQVGNNVRFSGINIGVIEDIEIISDTCVSVAMMLDENVRKFIKTDSKAIIGSDGLMGNKIISIMPGTSNKKTMQDMDIINTAAPVSIDDILINLKKTTGNASLIAEDLAVIVNNIRQGRGTIGKLFMDTVFAKNIDQAIINIKQGAGGFKQNMDPAGHSILLRHFTRKKDKTAK